MQKRRDWKLSPEERLDARRALTLLDGSGLSLEAAVRLALGKRSVRIQEVPTDEAVRAYLDEKKARLRPKTLHFYEEHLFAFVEAFDGIPMSGIGRESLERHFSGLKPFMASCRFRSIRAFFRWAINRPTPLVHDDPTRGIQIRQPVQRGDIQFLTVEEAAEILNGCPAHRHALALMLFAGIRPEEICGENKPPLEWRNVDTASRIVRIPADVAKTRQPRILENLPENLWRWLASAPKSGPICTIRPRSLSLYAQRAALFRDGGGSVIKKWPHDAMRHSFATYHVALLADPGRTSLILGHEGAPTMLYRHYRGLATKAQAEAYFGIVP